MSDRYSYAEQARHYRQAARDRGCTCPDLMAPHTHLLECPLYEVPGGVPSGLHDHRDSPAVETVGGEGPGAGGTNRPTEPNGPEPPAGDYLVTVNHLITEHRVTVDHAVSMTDAQMEGLHELHHHLDQEHDADEGRPWL